MDGSRALLSHMASFRTSILSEWLDAVTVRKAENLNFGFYLCAQLLQSCLTLCDPMDCSPPDSSVPGILQAGILEWVAMPSSRGSSQPRDRGVSHVSCTGGQVLTTSATWEAPFISIFFPMSLNPLKSGPSNTPEAKNLDTYY